MIKLTRLYSDPIVFDPITFQTGVNLILGEKVPETEVMTKKDKKTNGVGKSMCVEFINFALLKDFNSSRVMNIPDDKFSPETRIILDLIINDQEVSIIRSKKEQDHPTIALEGKETIFKSLKDAQEFLTYLYFGKESKSRISFRELMGPIIRDEDCEFQDILHCYDTKLKIGNSDLAKPHLYFFGIELLFINKIKGIFKNIEDTNTVISSLKKDLTRDKKIKISEVKAEANFLDAQLEKISSALDSFRSNEAYESVQNDLTAIQIEIDELRTEQGAVKYELRRIESLPKLEIIKKNDVELVYNQFKSGLGDMVSKSIKDVMVLKNKIDEFQTRLVNEKYETLKERLEKISEKLRELETQKTQKLQAVDERGILKDLKNGIKIYETKNTQFASIRTKLDQHEENTRKLSSLRQEKGDFFIKLDASIIESKKIIESFNKTILEVHDYIMGIKKASFDIKTIDSNSNKQIVEFEYRIDDDGSHSVDRTKVFIYDVSLMFNEFTRLRHPKMLIHDNIFDVDQDTLVQSLNFLGEQEVKYPDFQYILTLNRDKIENEERKKEITLDIHAHQIAQYTRQNKFLKTDYQEK